MKSHEIMNEKTNVSSKSIWLHCVLLAGIVAIISNQKIASMKQQEWKVYSACILAWVVIHISMSTNFAQVNQQATTILDQNTDHDYESNFIINKILKIFLNYIEHA